MKELVVCKSCGFVMEKSGLRDRCPACGVPAKMFLPYTDPLSPKRRSILALDLHPIMVHFTQAFATSELLLAIAAFVVSGSIGAKVVATLSVVSVVLPCTVILAFVAGMIDGKVRFRRLTAPLLRRKMVVGTTFFVFSAVSAVVVAVSPVLSRPMLGVIAGCGAISLVCATFLGVWGASLVKAHFPG
jgi:uncharacterized membrane protein